MEVRSVRRAIARPRGGQQQHARAHPRRGEGRLASCVPAADDENVICLGLVHSQVLSRVAAIEGRHDSSPSGTSIIQARIEPDTLLDDPSYHG
jgi:hypothetical protein